MKKLDKEGEEVPTYNVLGLQWNLLDNTIKPNTYFVLGKRKGGIGVEMIKEDTDDGFLVRRNFL